MSAEAILGAGISVGALGVLLLLLGWAQWMREVHSAATVLLLLGAVFVVVGAIAAMVSRSAKKS